jgi:hypothetical protein
MGFHVLRSTASSFIFICILSIYTKIFKNINRNSGTWNRFIFGHQTLYSHNFPPVTSLFYCGYTNLRMSFNPFILTKIRVFI